MYKKAGKHSWGGGELFSAAQSYCKQKPPETMNSMSLSFAQMTFRRPAKLSQPVLGVLLPLVSGILHPAPPPGPADTDLFLN